MARHRAHHDACGTAHALDLVGERWALLVVRELLLGPKRFTDLRSAIPDLSPNVLGQRLRELEEFGVLRRRVLPPPAASRVYELTEWGAALEPVVLALGRWGARSPTYPPGGEMSADALALALKSEFDPAADPDLVEDYELLLGDVVIGVRIAAGRIDVHRAPVASPAARFETDPTTVAALLWSGLDLDEALGTGRLRLHGSRSAADRFRTLFPTPRPATADGVLTAGS
jgi:DNA-binding HxlR family transcriptional regulator